MFCNGVFHGQKNIFTILEKLVKKYKYLHKPILDDYISTFTRTFLEYILTIEMKYHLNYERFERYLSSSAKNYRNGFSKKQLYLNDLKVSINIPRDRNGAFESKIISKYQVDISRFEYRLLSLGINNLQLNEYEKIVDQIFIDGFNLSLNKWLTIVITKDLEKRLTILGSWVINNLEHKWWNDIIIKISKYHPQVINYKVIFKDNDELLMSLKNHTSNNFERARFVFINKSILNQKN
ncbi:transposase [Ureaplasma parvum]|uniref:transposase n=1 Tax=Ureaplasma parvum TaxID=134821 RepID=UPI0026EE8BE9